MNFKISLILLDLEECRQQEGSDFNLSSKFDFSFLIINERLVVKVIFKLETIIRA